MEQIYLAHIREDGKTQTVEEHLKGTARLAAEFGRRFGCGEFAFAAGLYHDIGKCSAEFQKRLSGSSLHVDHSTAGAQCMARLGQLELAFAIAGHHGGLPDGGGIHDSADEPSLRGRLQRSLPDYSPGRKLLEPFTESLPRKNWEGNLFAQAFYIRMLYSCLVDADFLDTESFMRGEAADRGGFLALDVLLEKVRKQADEWLNCPPDREINKIRNEILRSCIDHGRENEAGVFTLTVPTGGGKTFASLAFALEHAVKNGMDRVIYVVPYTSIIDQTVDKFREILGEENVLAHYTGADYFCKDEECLNETEYRQVLASENWDAPVIVTTAVQFFESLYANRPARCRKLHNIANSVLIFDEAQTIPTDYLRPCVAALGQLVQRCRSSVVLCTATQPALDELFREFAPGYEIKELCETGCDLYSLLRRTSLKDLGQISEEKLASLLRADEQVLCVVNRRKTAQALFERLPEEGRYCLTTLLCPWDRRRLLEEIRCRLKAGLPCRVVSTSLIEAGVDLDFPIALREETGLDSVLQTAGRCNREGKKPAEKSPVYIFSLEGIGPPHMLVQNRDLFKSASRRFPGAVDTPEAIRFYFESILYVKGKQALDRKQILDGFNVATTASLFPFRQTADKFQLIESPTKTVYLPVGEGEELCEKLRQGFVSRSMFRRLGEYAVSVYPEHYKKLSDAGALEAVNEESAILADLNCYNSENGMTMDVEGGAAFYV